MFKKPSEEAQAVFDEHIKNLTTIYTYGPHNTDFRYYHKSYLMILLHCTEKQLACLEPSLKSENKRATLVAIQADVMAELLLRDR